MTQTIFEQLLDALLKAGHEVRFTKNKGSISMTLNSDGIVAIFGVTLEQIGQIAIESAVSLAFMPAKTPDQGGAGKTRIDGGETHDTKCKNIWHTVEARIDDKCPTCGQPE